MTAHDKEKATDEIVGRVRDVVDTVEREVLVGQLERSLAALGMTV